MTRVSRVHFEAKLWMWEGDLPPTRLVFSLQEGVHEWVSVVGESAGEPIVNLIE